MDATALFETIRNQDVDGAKKLLTAHPDLAGARMSNGVSLLLMAVYFGQTAIADAIRAGRTTIDIWEATALGEGDAVAALVAEDATRINAVAADGFAPLGLAAFFGRVELLGWLLDQGAAVDQPSQNEMRVRPVHSAAAHRQPARALKMMQALLAAGADVNVAQHGGWTPLHQAADHNHREMVKLLLARGADKAAKSEDGRTPHDMAAAKGYNEVATLLQ